MLKTGEIKEGVTPPEDGHTKQAGKDPIEQLQNLAGHTTTRLADKAQQLIEREKAKGLPGK